MAYTDGGKVKKGERLSPFGEKKIQILQITCIGALEVFIKNISFKKSMTELISIHIK